MHPEILQALLEPMVAHGSRMSWAGILRPDDEFPLARRSQLAVLTAESGPPLRRYFGNWSEKYHRFTINLTSSKIRARPLLPDQEPANGVLCFLHWVNRINMIRLGKGSVCHGDCWPTELWNAFVSELDNLPSGTIAEKLRSFLESDLQDTNAIVSQWRKRLREGTTINPAEAKSRIDMDWLPVPATLVDDKGGEASACVVSWSPSSTFHSSLTEALASEAQHRKPNLENQAKYYLECVLAKLHGVDFGENDFIEDEEYACSAEVRKFQSAFTKLEKKRIEDPKFGRLDSFGI